MKTIQELGHWTTSNKGTCFALLSLTMKTPTLKNKTIAILATDGFEKVELVIPRAALNAAGATVEIVSLHAGRIRGVNLHEPAGKVHVDKIISEVTVDDYDALFIPGGFINPDFLRQSAEVRKFVKAFDEAQKPIAVICHAAWVLASAELVRHRTLTSWPGMRDDLVHAGATWIDKEVVYDGNWLSSRGPQDLVPFTQALIEHFAHEGPFEKNHSQHTSSPKANEPPEAIAQVVHWTPRPSFRTAGAIGAVAAGFFLWKRYASEKRPD